MLTSCRLADPLGSPLGVWAGTAAGVTAATQTAKLTLTTSKTRMESFPTGVEEEKRLSPVLARSSRMSLVDAVPRLLGAEGVAQTAIKLLRRLRGAAEPSGNDRDEDR